MAALKASTTACEQFFFSHSLQGLYCDLSGRPESNRQYIFFVKINFIRGTYWHMFWDCHRFFTRVELDKILQ